MSAISHPEFRFQFTMRKVMDMAKRLSPLNEEAVRQLATILDETNLTEIEFEHEGCRIKVARHGTPLTTVRVPASEVSTPPIAPQEIPQAANESIDLSKHPGAVKSPMVGNVYFAAAPGAAPFVKLGDTVSQGDSILIIEAMKVMNQIKAPRPGVVKQILTQDSEPVEYDQVLMIIE
jgi:acetyl-CoA carboxylase biotin carboxyl carrier protein